MRPFGTTVWNPMRRSGQSGYTTCTGCGKQYTSFGIGRHWNRCPGRNKCYKNVEKLCDCTTECRMKGKRVELQ